jgi:hypothetical protein
MTEMTMSANQPLSSLHRLKWKTTSGLSADAEPQALTDFKVTLNPLEIKTFFVRFQSL